MPFYGDHGDFKKTRPKEKEKRRREEDSESQGSLADFIASDDSDAEKHLKYVHKNFGTAKYANY